MSFLYIITDPATVTIATVRNSPYSETHIFTRKNTLYNKKMALNQTSTYNDYNGSCK